VSIDLEVEPVGPVNSLGAATILLAPLKHTHRGATVEAAEEAQAAADAAQADADAAQATADAAQTTANSPPLRRLFALMGA
jgi:hypothetical protein